tara:strand:- start:2209 stop:2736 length:528 start_codon:yes stop_codon:yes gene_type:complete
MKQNITKSLIDTSLKTCNGYGLILNAFWLLTSLLYIYWFLKRESEYTLKKARIINIIDRKICRKRNNYFPFLTTITGEENFCTLSLEYTINNETINKQIEYNKCNHYRVSDTIDILYNKETREIILDNQNKLFRNLFYIIVIFLIIIIIFTFLRLFYSDNRWMKIYIALQCLTPG